MIALFTILTIVLVIVRVLLGYFVDAVGFFAPLLTPLTIASVVTGIVAFTLIVIKICGEIKKIIGKKKNKDDE